MLKDNLQVDFNKKIADLEQKVTVLETQNRFYELLIKNLPGVFYLFDNDLVFLKWNSNLEKVTGFNSEELKKITVSDLFTGENLNKIKNVIDETFDIGSSGGESMINTWDNRQIPYFFTGASTTIDNNKFIIGMGIDISNLKQAESGLRENESLYRILAERLSEGLVIFQESEIVFANKAVASILGYEDPSQLISKNVMEMVAEGFDVYFRDIYQTIQHDISLERSFQARWLTLENNEIWVEGKAVCIQWKGLNAVLLTIRDVTELKLNEINLREEAMSLRRENVTLRSSIKDRYRLGEVIGKSKSIKKVYEQIFNAAASNANVVIYGESGTGKELVAREVHKQSRRANKPFVAVNSSAIPVNLLESEFFGYQKGAFTGANSDKPGYLDLADGGTLFLDEIGDLDIMLQAKLLRAIEAGGYNPVGGTVLKHSDFRIISATHKNLLHQIKNGEMREDFFYRIHIIPIVLPPLRDRKDDIPLLVDHYLRFYSRETKFRELPGEVMKILMEYDYPGNIRELQNVIQRYLATKSIDFLYEDDLSSAAGLTETSKKVINTGERDLQDNLGSLEKEIISKMMVKYGGNKSRSAEALGITRKTLARKLKLFEEA